MSLRAKFNGVRFNVPVTTKYNLVGCVESVTAIFNIVWYSVTVTNKCNSVVIL